MKRRSAEDGPRPNRERSAATDGAGGGSRPPAEMAPHVEDENPGLPGFRRWREVYLMVFVVFVLVVVALAIFSRVYA